MQTVFADTVYWIALLNPRDQIHVRAISVSKNLGVARIVTSEEVLTEFLYYFAKRGPFFRGAATLLLEQIQLDRWIQIVSQFVSFTERVLIRTTFSL